MVKMEKIMVQLLKTENQGPIHFQGTNHQNLKLVPVELDQGGGQG